MPVVASWDGENRLIFLAQGVSEFHPIDDIYREYRTERRVNEDFRKWEPFMRADGNEPTGGGRRTPRRLVLLDNAKIVPFDEPGGNIVTATGEAITDNETDPFDTSTLTNPVTIRYQPAEAEVIEVDLVEALEKLNLLLKILVNKMVTDPDTGIATIFDDDDTSPLFTADLYEDADGTIPYRGDGADHRGRWS